MRRFRLTGPANKDLKAIWNYIAADNQSAADGLIERFYQTFTLIAGQPGMGRLAENLKPGLYRLPVGNYAALYRVTPRYIEIVRVIHGARDIDSLFGQ